MLVMLPCGLYLLVLFLSRQLDYQYVIPVTPIAAWAVGCSVPAIGGRVSLRAVRFGAILLVAVGSGVNFAHVSRQTIEFLGTDTRHLAAKWVEKHLAGKSEAPILVASGHYFHYYPALRFDRETCLNLQKQVQAAGGTGEFYRRAAIHAPFQAPPVFRADFLDVRTGFHRLPDGRRVFEPQPFSTEIGQYADRYSLVIVPSNTIRILERNAPELAELNAFLTQLLKLPVLATFHPLPFWNAGPDIMILRGPVSASQ
jgi:hypothetical protein